MKALLKIIVLAAVLPVRLANAKKYLACEYFERGYGGRECHMDKNTTIDSEGYEYALPEVDETIKTLEFAKNKKIQFLPDYVGRQMPKMLRLIA